MKEYAEKFYRSKKWRTARKTFISERIREDGGLCQECHERPGFIVHHKQEISPSNIDDPKITLSSENFEYVCKICHDKIHHAEFYGLKYFFDESGNPHPRN